MRLENTAGYPDREVRRVVVDALGADLARARWLSVRVMRVRSAKSTSDAAGNGTTGPVVITAKLQGPDFYPAEYSGEGYGTVRAKDWQERLFFLVAHESEHVRVLRFGNPEDDSEERADRHGVRRLRGARARRFLGLAGW